jgi:maintenance of morphology protein 1
MSVDHESLFLISATGNTHGYVHTTNPMSLSFPLFFQPTFTQGFIIGQLSILFLLGAILKYLFFESNQDDPLQAASYHQQVENDAFLRRRNLHVQKTATEEAPPESESSEWLNVLLKQVNACCFWCVSP